MKRIKSAAAVAAARAAVVGVNPAQIEQGLSFLQVTRCADLWFTLLTGMLQQVEDSAEQRPDLLSSTLCTRGMALAAAGDWQHACELFNRAQSIAPSATALYGVLQCKVGCCYMLVGRQCFKTG